MVEGWSPRLSCRAFPAGAGRALRGADLVSLLGAFAVAWNKGGVSVGGADMLP